MRLVQGQMGRELADHPARAARGDDRARQGRGQARLRGDDDDEEDRHRRDRGGSEGRMTPARRSAALRAWLIAGTLDIAYAMAWTTLAGGTVGGMLRGIARGPFGDRSEEHTSELQSLMRISYA